MKKIKINFSDFWSGFSPTDNYFYRLLSRQYEVEISDNPDYLFYSCFGREYLKYKNCIRIFFTGENIRPDFNLCDYAIGFDRMEFGDRYMRYPFYLLYERDWRKALKKHENILEQELEKKKFCNYVYSNPNMRTYRDEFLEQLSAYKRVDSGGKYRNNIGYFVKDKVKWQENYKFTIAFENSVSRGYTTEKLVHAYAAGTIPIYMGDPDVLKDFNPKSLIICPSREEFENVIQKVIDIDKNNALFLQMLKEPMLRDAEKFEQAYGEERLREFLVRILEQDIKKAVRRSDYKWTADLENENRYLRIIEKVPIIKEVIQNPHLLKRYKRYLKGKKRGREV